MLYRNKLKILRNFIYRVNLKSALWLYKSIANLF